MTNLTQPSATSVARLRENSEPGPLTVHRETRLADIPLKDPARHGYILICDDDDRIIGIVSTEEVVCRLNAENLFERNRWRSMPIGALSKLSLPDIDATHLPESGSQPTCLPIRDRDQLFGLSVAGDVFLSWRRLESLFTAALSDPLTGLMNRLAYDRRLREEWNRAERHPTSVAVVILDLDRFKQVNDTWGHAVGDEMLMRVGRQLEVSMRSYDVVARFGGDEFVALCLGCGPGDIRIPVTRLLASLKEIQVPVGDGTTDVVTVGASIGAAVRHSGFRDNAPEDLFVAADRCLYEAKKSRDSAWKVELGGGSSEPQPIAREFCVV
ncbi:MAG: GGDEF domain-containing protein [Planctomycetaceae bacterium]|nr:GGDEF domain-containing protein [Planctomycetaceae bacterium]